MFRRKDADVFSENCRCFFGNTGIWEINESMIY